MNRRMLAVIVMALLPPLLLAGAWWWEGSHPLRPGLDGCVKIRDSREWLPCLQERIGRMNAELGYERARKEVNRQAKDSFAVAENCHMAWHPTGERDGRAAAARGDTPDVIRSTSRCDEGYVHGYLIAWFDAPDADDGGVEQAKELCASFASQESRQLCHHSFGHHMARSDDGAQDVAGASCTRMIDGLARTEQATMLLDCLYGYWMERSLLDAGKRRTGPLDNCETEDPASLLACTMFLPSRVLALTGDERASANACAQHARSSYLQRICAQWIGHQGRMKRSCNLIDDESLEFTCLLGMRNPTAAGVEDVALLLDGPPRKQAAKRRQILGHSS